LVARSRSTAPILGSFRPEKSKEDRIDRRLREHQTGRRRVVVALRERNAAARGREIAREELLPGAMVLADEAPHWDELHFDFPSTGRINHSMGYADGDSHTNGLRATSPGSTG